MQRFFKREALTGSFLARKRQARIAKQQKIKKLKRRLRRAFAGKDISAQERLQAQLERLLGTSERPAKDAPSRDFFASQAWRAIRYQVLRERGGKCCACGRAPSTHPGVVVHVDHVKPRSKYPELALVKANLQVLCEDCNLGKGNSDSIDWSVGPS